MPFPLYLLYYISKKFIFISFNWEGKVYVFYVRSRRFRRIVFSFKCLVVLSMLVRMPFIIYDNVYILLYQNVFGVLPTEISLLEGYLNRSYQQDPDWYDLFIISFFWGILLIDFLAIRDRAQPRKSCTPT